MTNYIIKYGQLSDLPIAKDNDKLKKTNYIQKSIAYTLDSKKLEISNIILTNLANGKLTGEEYNSYRKNLLDLEKKNFKFLGEKNGIIDVTSINKLSLIDMYYEEIVNILNSDNNEEIEDLIKKSKDIYGDEESKEYTDNPLYLIKKFNSHIMSVINNSLPIKKPEDLNLAYYFNYYLKQKEYYDSDPYTYLVNALYDDLVNSEFYNNEFHIKLLEKFIINYLRNYITYYIECFITKINIKNARQYEVEMITYYKDRKIKREKEKRKNKVK